MRRTHTTIAVGLASGVLTVLLSAGAGSTAGAAATTDTHVASHQPSASKKPAQTLSFPATGYFRVAQADDRWWFVTPTGQPFYADGVDHVAAGGDTDQVTGQCPYCETISAEYPSTAAWGTATLARLRSWGFNTLGDYSDDSTLGAQMPFTVQLSMASGDDWFSSSFVTNADAVAAAQVPQYTDNPNLIGYFTDSELTWGPPNTPNQETALQEYLNLPAGSPGLAVAQQYEGNPNGFVYALAKQYFSVTTAAIHMYDPNHLILGVKAEGQEIQPELLEAAQGYVNVFSVEDYSLKDNFAQIVQKVWPQYLAVEPDLANMEKYFNGPMMIGEYSFIAPGADPNTVPGIYYVSANQQARANDYANFVAPLYEDAPWVIGDGWFEYVDEPANGRVPDGENNDFGLVNVDDQPYPDLVSAASLLHSILPDRLVESGPVCDSWAPGPDGALCNATMTNQTYPVSIIAEPLVAGKQGTTYADTVYAAGGRPTYKFTVVQGHLPKGLKLDKKTGVVSGSPKNAGTSAFTLQVIDATGSKSTQTESITIAPDIAVSIDTTSLGRARVGSTFSKTLKATGGTPPYTWSITSASLPLGLTLDPDGELGGMPTTSGTFTFGVTVTDSTAPPLTETEAFSLTVRSS